MQILEELKECGTIGISGHENPDGDCAGACLGLALYLRKVMPQARVDVFLEPLRDELYKNIPGAETVITDFQTARSQVRDGFDAVIVPQDETAIADAIESLLGDEEKRRQLSENARASDYGNASEAEKIYRMIEE